MYCCSVLEMGGDGMREIVFGVECAFYSTA